MSVPYPVLPFICGKFLILFFNLFICMQTQGRFARRCGVAGTQGAASPCNPTTGQECVAAITITDTHYCLLWFVIIFSSKLKCIDMLNLV